MERPLRYGGVRPHRRRARALPRGLFEREDIDAGTLSRYLPEERFPGRYYGRAFFLLERCAGMLVQIKDTGRTTQVLFTIDRIGRLIDRFDLPNDDVAHLEYDVGYVSDDPIRLRVYRYPSGLDSAQKLSGDEPEIEEVATIEVDDHGRFVTR